MRADLGILADECQVQWAICSLEQVKRRLILKPADLDALELCQHQPRGQICRNSHTLAGLGNGDGGNGAEPWGKMHTTNTGTRTTVRCGQPIGPDGLYGRLAWELWVPVWHWLEVYAERSS